MGISSFKMRQARRELSCQEATTRMAQQTTLELLSLLLSSLLPGSASSRIVVELVPGLTSVKFFVADSALECVLTKVSLTILKTVDPERTVVVAYLHPCIIWCLKFR